MTPRGLLFDKDGTLLDFDATWRPFAERLAREAAGGDAAAAANLMETAGFDSATGTFRPGSALAAGTGRDVAALFYPHLSGTDLDAVVTRLDREAVAHVQTGLAAIDGVAEALHMLHAAGFVLGMATNDSEAGAEACVEIMGVQELFAGVLGYDSVANPKPAPDMLHAFAGRTGLAPDEIAVIGDNTHDLDLARTGGAGVAIAVLTGNGTREVLEPLADIILPGAADLPRHFGLNA